MERPPSLKSFERVRALSVTYAFAQVSLLNCLASAISARERSSPARRSSSWPSQSSDARAAARWRCSSRSPTSARCSATSRPAGRGDWVKQRLTV